MGYSFYLSSMKSILTTIFFLLSFSVFSQPVIAVDYVKTKPGEFDDFVEFLKKNWVVAREKAKEKGFILSFEYQTNPKDTGWDITLVTEYKDETAFKEREKIFQQIFKEYFPNGPVLVNGKRSRDMADIKGRKEIKKE